MSTRYTVLVPPTAAAGSNVVLPFVFFFIWRSILRVLPFFLPSAFFLLVYTYDRRSRVAWVDDELDLLDSCCLTHPLRGRGIVDRRKTER